ncbi:MAG: methionyl-tRNA formyltransferase [Rubrobacteraceae bacterium]
MNVAFAGTPEFAATILRGLLDSEHEVGLVVSQPDARRGRGRKTARPPVAEAAIEAGVPLRQPACISEVAQEVSAHDVLVVAAYGQILRPDTLYAPPPGAYNVHASLLPAYRGAAPIERAIMAGETETGVSIMRMDEGLDTGPVALHRRLQIASDTTGGELTQALAVLGSKAVTQGLSLLASRSLTLTSQDSLKATYAARILVQDTIVRWEKRVKEVHDQVRALAPHIGARAFHPEIDGPIKILRSLISEDRPSRLDAGEIYGGNRRIFVGCGSGALEILELQKPGSRVLDAESFLLGNRLEGHFDL